MAQTLAVPFTPLQFNGSADNNRAQFTRSTSKIPGGAYAFFPLNTTPEDTTRSGDEWSTRDIVEYLMTYCLPTNGYLVAAIPWSVIN